MDETVKTTTYGVVAADVDVIRSLARSSMGYTGRTIEDGLGYAALESGPVPTGLAAAGHRLDDIAGRLAGGSGAPLTPEDGRKLAEACKDVRTAARGAGREPRTRHRNRMRLHPAKIRRIEDALGRIYEAVGPPSREPGALEGGR